MAPASILPLVGRRDIVDLLDRAAAHRAAASEAADPAERWRHLLLAELARSLALFEYLSGPGATIEGARDVVLGLPPGRAAT
jgi:hypothetical protein